MDPTGLESADAAYFRNRVMEENYPGQYHNEQIVQLLGRCTQLQDLIRDSEMRIDKNIQEWEANSQEFWSQGIVFALNIYVIWASLADPQNYTDVELMRSVAEAATDLKENFEALLDQGEKTLEVEMENIEKNRDKRELIKDFHVEREVIANEIEQHKQAMLEESGDE